MRFKQNSIEVKDLDNKKGIVTAYANVYNFEDADQDISEQGSFNKTVSENFKRIRVLKDHNPTMSIGVPLEMDANDPYGLLTVTKFNMNKQLSKDMFTDIQLAMENGLNAELSIGYEVIKRNPNDKKKISEYKLYEYSFLSSWAANELSIVQDIKSIKSHYGILSLIEKSYNLNYSDARLKQIEAILKTLTSNEPVKETTPEIEPFVSLINNYTKNL